jgi:nitrogen fixation NifU-like protein
VVIEMDPMLKRSIILDHYQNPRNKSLVEDDSYIFENMNNTSCIDEVNVQIKFNEEGIVEDVRFDGEACAMCTSSASIMVETLIGKTIDEVKEILKNFSNMIDEKEYNEDILEEAIVYDDVYKQPNRKKCVLLPWWGIEKALEEVNAKQEIS